jgi:methionyl-tRNA formyltransferase
MHGSLLPKYRGRVPINWAVLHGETETGATLHRMVEKPDAGEIVAQQAVPILPDDTAKEVFDKVVVAAEICLTDVLPGLMRGSAPQLPMDLRAGSYFGGRKAEDGRIDWTQSAQQIHNLVRAVAPPYPGAFFDLADKRRLRILRTQRLPMRTPRHAGPTIYRMNQDIFADCADGAVLRILAIDGNWDDATIDLSTALVGPAATL